MDDKAAKILYIKGRYIELSAIVPWIKFIYVKEKFYQHLRSIKCLIARYDTIKSDY